MISHASGVSGNDSVARDLLIWVFLYPALDAML